MSYPDVGDLVETIRSFQEILFGRETLMLRFLPQQRIKAPPKDKQSVKAMGSGYSPGYFGTSSPSSPRKTYTALAVSKYFELRNERVLGALLEETHPKLDHLTESLFPEPHFG